MENTKKILIVTPHPDDETLGCGGTILKHKSKGDEVFWLIVTNLYEPDWTKERIFERQKEIENVAEKYGFDKTIKMDYPTTKLDTYPLGDLIQNFSNVLNEIKPDEIFINYFDDIHSDHRVVFDSFMSSSKNFNMPSIKKILMYETLSETEFSANQKSIFIPNTFYDVSEFFEQKIEIMKIYKSELMKENYPRNPEIIKCLGRLRGSRIGAKYAEAFQLLFEVS